MELSQHSIIIIIIIKLISWGLTALSAQTGYIV